MVVAFLEIISYLGGDPRGFSDIVNRVTQRIAFFTMGDCSTYLANAIYEYGRQRCDVLVCSLSTNTTKVRPKTL